MEPQVRDVTGQRDTLRQDDNCTFVGSAEFQTLLLSTSHLVRSDVNPARVRGLRDMEGDHLFVIEVEKLRSLEGR